MKDCILSILCAIIVFLPMTLIAMAIGAILRALDNF